MKWAISGKTYFIWLSGQAKGSSTEDVRFVLLYCCTVDGSGGENKI